MKKLNKIILGIFLISTLMNVGYAEGFGMDAKIDVYDAGEVAKFETKKDYIVSLWNPDNPSVVCNNTIALRFAGRQKCFTEAGYSELKTELTNEFKRNKTEKEKMANGKYADMDVNYLIPFFVVLNKEVSARGMNSIDFSKLGKNPIFRIIVRSYLISLLG